MICFVFIVTFAQISTGLFNFNVYTYCFELILCFPCNNICAKYYNPITIRGGSENNLYNLIYLKCHIFPYYLLIIPTLIRFLVLNTKYSVKILRRKIVTVVKGCKNGFWIIALRILLIINKLRLIIQCLLAKCWQNWQPNTKY